MKKIILLLAFLFFLGMIYFFFISKELLPGSLFLLISVILNIVYAVIQRPADFSQKDKV